MTDQTKFGLRSHYTPTEIEMFSAQEMQRENVFWCEHGAQVKVKGRRRFTQIRLVLWSEHPRDALGAPQLLAHTAEPVTFDGRTYVGHGPVDGLFHNQTYQPEPGKVV